MLLRKGFYPYEYIDSWEEFDKNLLPDKKAFYSKLNLEDITDKDYEHAQKVWEVFEIKKSWRVSWPICSKQIHYCLQMYLNTLEICVLKYMNLILLIFFCTRISMASLLKKDNSKSRIINRYWYVTDGWKRN